MTLSLRKQGHELFTSGVVPKSGSFPPRSFRNTSCPLSINQFLPSVNPKGLLLLTPPPPPPPPPPLCGDISLVIYLLDLLMVGPSIRNKDTLISDTVTSNGPDILALVRTHIGPENTNSLLHSATPAHPPGPCSTVFSG